MVEVPPAVVTFLRRLAAHVAGQRTYLSFGERARLVAAVGQFSSGYSEVKLGEDILFRSVDRLRVALGDVILEDSQAAVYTLVATIQIALADSCLDRADIELVHWVSDALGFDRPRVERAIELADGQVGAVGAAPAYSLA